MARKKKPPAENARLTLTGDPYPQVWWCQPAPIKANQVPGSRIAWLALPMSPDDVAAAQRDMHNAHGHLTEPYPRFECLRISPREEFTLHQRVATPERRAAFDAPLEAATLKNLERLFDFYGVDIAAPHAWKAMVLILAERHVPGFRPIARSDGGAPAKWTPIRHLLLYGYIRSRRESGKKLSVPQIIRSMPKKFRKIFPGKKPETLRVQYYAAAKDPLIVQHVESLIAQHGPDWITRWIDGDFELDVDASRRGMFPVLVAKAAV